MRLFRRDGGSPSSLDLLVVGLGNPGREHANNRHNVGWMVVDVVIYDNNSGSADDATPTTLLGGGSISIHA